MWDRHRSSRRWSPCAFRHDNIKFFNLDDSSVSLEALAKQFQDYPIAGLEEVLIVRNGNVSRFWP